ncbi:MAG: DUF4350 domain-containing protein [bacterium]|nr:DUF4350 domain-containing protein [bacterium]
MRPKQAKLSPLLRSALMLALAALLLTACVLWFRANYEKKAVSVPVVDFSRKAPHAFAFTAAYLQHAGHRVQVREGMRFFSDLPAPGSILILRNLPNDARGELWQRVYNWVKDGGHLVLAPSATVGKSEAAFFARIGAEVLVDESLACTQNSCPTQSKQQNARQEQGGPFLLHATVEAHPLRLSLDAPPRLFLRAPHQATWRVQGMLQYPGIAALAGEPAPSRFSAPQADLLQQHSRGRGSITLLSSMQPFMGAALEREDNAFFLSAIIRNIGGLGAAQHLWFWLPGQSDSLVKRLLAQYPLFLTSLALMLIVLLLSLQARLGPPLALKKSARRDVLAYFDGAGRFAWRVNRAAGLIKANRAELSHALQRRRSTQIGQEAGGQQSNQAAAADKEEQVALHSGVQSSQDLLRVSKAMQQVRLRQFLRSSKKRGRTN